MWHMVNPHVRYVHLADGEAVEAELDAAAFDRRARALAARLAGVEGERVLLIARSGAWFAAALVGCWLAGKVAVPTPVATPRTADRIRAIAESARASAVVTEEAILLRRGALAPHLPWIAVDRVAEAPFERAAAPAPDDLAYLQYTSGSTGAPRGVAVTHRNLLDNVANVAEGVGLGASSRLVSWVPPHHDLGLVYAVVAPMVLGFTAVTLSPEAFIERPIRWLRAIHAHRGTHTVAPDFAYEIAAKRTTPEERAGLDLTSLVAALNGGESVRRASEDRFREAYGIPEGVLFHSYGLAEATAKVTAERPGHRGRFLRLDREKLAVDEVVEAADGAEVACCGVPAGDLRVAIAAGDAPAAPGRVGEIWLQGTSVAQGYASDPAATEETFGGTLEGHDGRWLRTGDLGFLRDGALYVTGRLKDLIIVRGENHYPHDLEWAFRDRHPALRPTSAAFSIEADDREQVAIVAEVRPEALDVDAVVAVIREACAGCGVKVEAILLTAAGAIPKTSSGKVQRRLTRERFLRGELPILAAWRAPAGEALGDESAEWDEVERCVRRRIAERIRVPAASLTRADTLGELGIDSIEATEIEDRIRADLALDLDAGFLFDHRTIGDLIDALRAERARS